MVEVFKTNLEGPEQADQLKEVISIQFPSMKVDIDLTDIDKILRVECKEEVLNLNELLFLIKAQGVVIQMLEDV